MNSRSSLGSLAFLLATLAAAGCADQQWLRGKPQDAGSAVAVPAGSSGLGGWKSALGAKSSDRDLLKNPLPLARLSERRGQFDQAGTLYHEAIRRSPNDPAPHHRLAVLHARRGNWEQAEQYFARALAIKPDDANLLSDLGYFCYLCQRLEEAEQHLRRATQLDHDNRACWNNLALVVGEQGRYDESLALFRRLGTDNEAYANLAFVLAQRGEYERALEIYNRVLTQDPKMRTAAEAMIELAKHVPQTSPAAQTAMRTPAGRPAVYHQPASGQEPSTPAAHLNVVDAPSAGAAPFAQPQAGGPWAPRAPGHSAGNGPIGGVAPPVQ